MLQEYNVTKPEQEQTQLAFTPCLSFIEIMVDFLSQHNFLVLLPNLSIYQSASFSTLGYL